MRRFIGKYCIIGLLFGFINACGENGPIKCHELKKSEFTIEKILHADGDEYYSPEGKFYYSIGYTEPSFMPGDTPILHIPHWNLLLLEDTVIFQKPIATSNIKVVYCLPLVDSIGMTQKQTGMLCQDTRKTTVKLENSKHKSILKNLGECRFFQYNTKHGLQAYLISYHHCLVPELTIYRVTE